MTAWLHEDSGAHGRLPVHCAFQTACFAVLPVAYDGTSTWLRGADHGPLAMTELLANPRNMTPDFPAARLVYQLMAYLTRN